ncbi:MAG: sigma-54-dependent Fis family transcriptional regulator [Gammaproteobacteria bacterium]|nr:sigma-54-dependent Fis family transcriptional regulator [Gammaproteobacteria bacterium]MBU1777021.1 sigma-54-dependent Fis family transcriptional regulator [Gammaproteobacteria bacterium]MBU1967963.1 sigma-54-dependent Fis family transcriptional regulator [Gammaproteobacteria bacterium]
MKSPLLPELVSFIDTLPEPHILCDREYRVLAANTAYRRSFGENQVFVGRTCFDISHHFKVPCDQAGETCPVKQSLRSGQRERVLHLHQTPQGEAYVNIELSPIRNGKGDIVYFIEKMEPVAVARGLSYAQGLVGRAPIFQHMLEMVARVAPSEATVLLLGESGTGKELVAKAIHDASRRAEKPFVALDCSGLTETLFESELFGHERGAFTGATARSVGLIEAANGGTLFLDEVGDIPLAMQVKLLRLLETGTYRRVGSSEPHKADIRLVSATHRDLRKMVTDGSFRQDLYFRLNTFPVELPPLRKRPTDIPLLAKSLLARVAPERNLVISEDALKLLRHYDYPGNVRELRNIIERASLLCDGEAIQPAHLPEEVRSGRVWREAPISLSPKLKELERQTLLARLAHHRGSRKMLAAELGISERTLYRRLKHFEK